MEIANNIKLLERTATELIKSGQSASYLVSLIEHIDDMIQNDIKKDIDKLKEKFLNKAVFMHNGTDICFVKEIKPNVHNRNQVIFVIDRLNYQQSNEQTVLRYLKNIEEIIDLQEFHDDYPEIVDNPEEYINDIENMLWEQIKTD